jgi:hypothetical protein
MGENDYRSGSRERLEEAFILLGQERFGCSIYLAGRAVEGMLRAVIWRSDPEYSTGKKSLETGHSLLNLLEAVGRLGVLRDNPLKDEIAAHVQHVGRLWWNDMRFLPQNKIKTKWYELKEIQGKRTLKVATNEYYDSCSVIIKRCEALWQS